MDMITRAQLQDAVDSLTLAAARMKEVAFKVASSNLPAGLKPADFYLDGFRVGSVEGREDYVHVRLSCPYFSSEERDDGFESADSMLIRHVDFPIRYLTELDESWEPELEKKNRNKKRFLARTQLAAARASLEMKKRALDEARARVLEIETLASEPDEE